MPLKYLGLLLPLAGLIAALPQPEKAPVNSFQIPNSVIARPYGALARRQDQGPPDTGNGTTLWAHPIPFVPGCEGWGDSDCANHCHHHCCQCWTWDEPCCGNGYPDPGEECDLGPFNGFPGSGCDINCKIVCPQPPKCNPPTCGDGEVNQPTEECDDGDKNGTPDSKCTKDCKWKPCTDNCCGNGVVNAGEECDDGVKNGTPDSKCTTECKWKEGCCPQLCNPLPGLNQCDQTTSCIWIPGAPGANKYMCACRSGYRASGDPSNTNVQVRLPYTGLQAYVFVAPGTACDFDCAVDGSCNKVLVQDQCFDNVQ